jgi:hypothetical protein
MDNLSASPRITSNVQGGGPCPYEAGAGIQKLNPSRKPLATGIIGNCKNWSIFVQIQFSKFGKRKPSGLFGLSLSLLLVFSFKI